MLNNLERYDYTESVNELKNNSKLIQAKLYSLQQKVKEAKIPIIILIEGWGASGKGITISDIIKTLDPRFFSVKSTLKPNDYEKRYPLMKRFWDRIPAKGEILILDRSWYQELAIAKMEHDISNSELEQRFDSVNTFERQLSDDGYKIIKLFLHISKSEQKRRFVKLGEKKYTSWRVSKQDKLRHKEYDEYKSQFSNMLNRTNSSFAPWNVIDAYDRDFTKNRVLSIILDEINNALKCTKNEEIAINPVEKKRFDLLKMPKLSELSPSDFSIASDAEYKTALKLAKKKLAKLHGALYERKIPVVIAFEGWDAAGKGGAIRRVTSGLDPRGYEAIPISAPSKEELEHHYLWRFWKKIPKTGHISIFDRTWYGRVMVERIEGFTPDERCNSAFCEINEFEQELTDNGTIVMKFYLHIDKDEQLKRFELRQNTPSKQWKITPDDWRNREKWDLYEVAIDEMIMKTSTKDAPWFIIATNDKKYARIQIMNIIIERIEKYMEK